MCRVEKKIECAQLMGGEGSLFAQLHRVLIMVTLLYRALYATILGTKHS